MTSVRARLLPAVVCGASVLAALDLAVGLTAVGWLLGAAFDVATVVLLGRAWVRSGHAPHPADQVTLLRATLVGGVTALVAGSFSGPANVTVLVGVATVALVLDAVDGHLARRTHTVSGLGARFDMEVDAFLILVLSVYVARGLGAWVLLIGAARYLLLAAGYLWPWLRRPTPPRHWGKVVAAIQGIVLTIVAADLLARPAEIVVTVTALALLAESFAHQVAWLARERTRRKLRPVVALGAAGSGSESGGRQRARAVVAPGLTVVAVAVVWLGLVLPDRLDWLVPGTFVQIPAEGLVLTAAALLLPTRPRQILAVVVGTALGLLVLLKLLDMGYYAELNRAFDPIIDWGSLGQAFGVLRDSVGLAWAFVAAGAVVLFAAAVVAVSAWASLRVARRSAAHRRGSAWIVGTSGVVWIASAIIGFNVVPQTHVASLSATSFAVAQVQSVAAAARDRVQFADQLARADPYSTIPGADLLAGLRGKDVIIVFVESYGRTAVQGSTFAPGIVSVLDEGTKALTAAGFSSRSALLTSPTFGGVSWLAHATLQSGLWIDDKLVYEQLMDSRRFTLSSAFKKAGWRTVGDAPANTASWPEGTSFYHYDQLYNAVNTGYQGPRYSYATMPDQYTLAAFQRLELTPGHAPVMAEIDLVSSHIPWVPLPRMIDWSDVGDGSVYHSLPAQGPSAATVYGDDDALRAAYGRSIQYSLESIISFVRIVDDDNLVLVLLGDHQPSPRVSGSNATHDVPIAIIARDPAVMDRISSWRWQPGLRPDAHAPVWPMDAFRNRLFDAFNRCVRPDQTTPASSTACTRP